ncbi:BRCT domain-containing protein [Lactococcus petauri]|uniref:BRCT domain-containing protein n=1 Tax=Lactococcus petauri TaxID=1940789 RepID=UPI002550E3DE|nr:BRCT domain-containing protein [Lactococcus petauri]
MLKDEYFVFTRTLTTMIRIQVQSIITGLKGHNQSSVTKKTTRLVIGYFLFDLIKGYYPSQKLLEAEEAVQSGQQIKIMSEKEFIELIAQTFQLLSKGL